MIAKTVLPFKLGMTSDTITSHAGLALLGEYAQGIGLPGVVDTHLPWPGSGAGYRPSEFVLPLVLMLNGGGQSLEDLREVRRDTALRALLGWDGLPSSDAVGNWLRRSGKGGGLSGLARVNREVLKRALKDDGLESYTLDMDATAIEADKRSARMTYKGFRGYMPMVGHLAENGLVVADEFGEGNDNPGARNLEFLKRCSSRMPEGKRIGVFRSDSAAYQGDVLNYCESEGMAYAVGADLDVAVLAAIRAIPGGDWRPFQEGHIAETVHSMEKTPLAFRLVVVRRPVQGELFDGEDPRVRYTVIASNREETAEETVGWYNARGEHSENRIKELKIGLGMERMPCGQLEANAVFFRIGVLAYNLFRMFELKVLPEEWHHHQIRTVRWRLYQVAGKVARHAGQVSLKVRQAYYGLFEMIRRRIRVLATA